MNSTCTDVFASIDAATAWSEGKPVLPVLVMLPSAIFLALGYRIYRAVGAASAAVGAASLAYYVTDPDIDCVTRATAIGASAVAAGLFALCLLTQGLVLLGSAAFGFTAHFAFDSIGQIASGYVALERNTLYWVVVSGASVLGGLVVYFKRKATIVLTTSLVGAFGLVVPLAGIVGDGAPPVVWPLAWVALLAAGLSLQTYGRRRAQRRIDRRAPVTRPEPSAAHGV